MYNEDNDLLKQAEITDLNMMYGGNMQALNAAPFGKMTEDQRQKERWEQTHVMAPPLLSKPPLPPPASAFTTPASAPAITARGCVGVSRAADFA